ncbi:hypothetical protein ABT147_17375 [Streptomyces sp. NPDC001868]|uniref:hypothetical protein n=1 Tax=Streptomyces sp. NPDC001868 TaxID=3154401 RepID=UPI003326BE44
MSGCTLDDHLLALAVNLVSSEEQHGTVQLVNGVWIEPQLVQQQRPDRHHWFALQPHVPMMRWLRKNAALKRFPPVEITLPWKVADVTGRVAGLSPEP